ncbi:MAG: ATP-binding protein [Acidobacteria bacterium]|nr:ATP-binding protein [Acidobacteriota bacterium]
MGGTGTGKSHIEAGLMRELYKRGLTGSFCKARDFTFRCQSSFRNEESIAEIVAEHLDGRFLVVDDLGSEKPTEFVRQCIVHLVDEAYTDQRILVVSSNATLDTIEHIDPRIASRLAEMCHVVEFNEPDYRLRIARDRRLRRGQRRR